MRILIVEDEIKLANAMKRALELQSYAVDVAYDGTLGLDLAIGEEFDLIILDSMLPGKDGLEICQELRSSGIKTPVLFLTAKGQVSDRVTGLDSGADDYMVKPFSFEELFARVRALIRRAGKVETPILCVGSVELDPAAHIVQRDGQEIDLSFKEFALLEYLMRHPNKVHSKEQLVAHVWDYDADILPSTVEVHIKNLRDKIDKPSSDSLIQTVRGLGYVVKSKV